MTFRPFNAETLAELAAIQAALDQLIEANPSPPLTSEDLCSGHAAYQPFSTSFSLAFNNERNRLEFEHQQIYQAADYDLAHKHRGN